MKGRVISVEEYRALTDGAFKRPTKYRNVPVTYDSPLHGPLKCPSKRQARLFAELDRRWKAGELRAPYWLPEVPLPLGTDAGPGGRRRVMRVDALVFLRNGGEEWLDAKGHMVEAWSVKMDVVRGRLGIGIKLW